MAARVALADAGDLRRLEAAYRQSLRYAEDVRRLYHQQQSAICQSLLVLANALEAKDARKPYVTQLLEGRQGPAIAATDYVRAFANQIREYVPMRYSVLGTDGYGRSDTRANLRRHFEVDRFHVAHAAVAALAADGKLTAKDVARAIKLYKLDPEKPNPLTV